MDTIPVHKAKTTLSQLLVRVEGGEEIIVSRHKRPVAVLVPFRPAPSKRRFGAMKGLITIAPDFDAPLPEEELAAWE